MADTSPGKTITRRSALTGLAVASGGTLAASAGILQPKPAAAAVLMPDSTMCVLVPEAVEGPYYFDPKLVRSDITEGRPGIPTRLALQVVEAGPCTAIAGARVDVWHADAIGYYSGYDRQSDAGNVSTVGQTFLRGTQTTDANGQVTFQTVYPGWYRGRTAHIHFKVLLSDKLVAMGQIYFPDALSAYVYANVPPYNARTAERDTVNATDSVLKASGGGHTSFCSVKEETDYYLASLIVSIDRTATITNAGQPNGPPPGGPPPGGAGGPPAQQSAPTGPLVPGAKTE